jgi:hypothetical protein
MEEKRFEKATEKKLQISTKNENYHTAIPFGTYIQ